MRTLFGATHPEGSLTELDQVERVTAAEFIDDYRSPGRPVKITDQIGDWEAMRSWDIERLRDRLPDVEVKLDVGNSINTPGLTFVTERLHRYLDGVAGNSADGHSSGPGADEAPRYLQAFNLFGLAPDLADDIDVSLMADGSAHTSTLAWVGPSGTVTGYHADLGDNLLSQVRGSKLVKLVPPSQSALLYPVRKYDPNGLVCGVDADDWDAEAHPDFARVDALYTVIRPGETLFIPCRWWHHVRSLEPSISVNCFGYTLRQLAVNKTADKVRRLLHNVGLYGSECTCHMRVDGRRVARG